LPRTEESPAFRAGDLCVVASSDARLGREVQWKIKAIGYWEVKAGGFFAARPKRAVFLPPAPPSNVNLFRDTQRVLKLNTEVTHCTIHFGVTDQELDSAQIVGLA